MTTAVLFGACSTTTEIGGGSPVTGTGVQDTAGGGPGLPMSAEACALSHDTLEVAAETYLAIHGAFPETMQQMVDANLLMSAPADTWNYSYTAGDRDYIITAVVGGPCD